MIQVCYISTSESDETLRYALTFGKAYKNANFTTKKLYTKNDIKFIVYKYTELITRVIVIGSITGFLLWARDGEIKHYTIQTDTDTEILHVTEFGGYLKGETNWSTIYEQSVYPMYDQMGHIGTFLLNLKPWINEQLVDVAFCGLPMTNCYWENTNNTYVNWRGTPNRHFGLDPSTNYPMVVEAQNAGPTYSPFSSYVYKGGVIFAKAPETHLVTGAFYVEDKLHCVTWSNYNEYILKENGDITNGQNWLILSERPYNGLPLVPTFITQNTIVSGDGGRYTNLSYTHNERDNSTGSLTIETDGVASLNFSGTSTEICWEEPEGSVIVTTTATLTSSLTSSGSSSGTTEVPLYTKGEVTTFVGVYWMEWYQIRSVYESLTGITILESETDKYWGAYARPNGIYCNITWSSNTVNGCMGPVSMLVFGNGEYVVGKLPETECSNGANFQLTAVTNTGVSGRSGYFSTLNCNNAPVTSIVAINAELYSFRGQIAGSDNRISWSVSGGIQLLSDPTENIAHIEIVNCEGDGQLTVTGSCGSATMTIPGSTAAPPTYTYINGYSDDNDTVYETNAFDCIVFYNYSSITVTVTDCRRTYVAYSCGESTTVTLRASGGAWVQQGSENLLTCSGWWPYSCELTPCAGNYDYPCSIKYPQLPDGYPFGYESVTTIHGTVKRTGTVGCVDAITTTWGASKEGLNYVGWCTNATDRIEARSDMTYLWSCP